MKHCRSHHRPPPRRSKARFEATIALQTPAHPRMAISDRHAPRPHREKHAADELTRWRTQHPNATRDELRQHWREIQIDWNLSTTARTPR